MVLLVTSSAWNTVTNYRYTGTTVGTTVPVEAKTLGVSYIKETNSKVDNRSDWIIHRGMHMTYS